MVSGSRPCHGEAASGASFGSRGHFGPGDYCCDVKGATKEQVAELKAMMHNTSQAVMQNTSACREARAMVDEASKKEDQFVKLMLELETVKTEYRGELPHGTRGYPGSKLAKQIHNSYCSMGHDEGASG